MSPSTRGTATYNERSIGIEHEGFVDRPQDFTDAMYRSSARLTAGICARYGIPVDREHIIGHAEVPGTDHTDPGRTGTGTAICGWCASALPRPRGSAGRTG